MKDLFSSHSAAYANFRPGYPAELFLYLKDLLIRRDKAWDCATGNGQVAGELSDHFGQICGTDISVQQLSQAVQKPNIKYTRQRAEATNFPDDYFDLITVGQAIHWFDFNDFYTEAKRVLKKDAVIAIFGYALFRSNVETNEIMDHFYENVIGPYWQPERKYLDQKYQTLPFPFEELIAPEFELKQRWSFQRLKGYLNTWSAVKSYERAHGENPVNLIQAELLKSFGEVGTITFPTLLRVGRNSEIIPQ